MGYPALYPSFDPALRAFYKAYYGQPLPHSFRMLTPASAGFNVQRTDDRTLVIQSQALNIFSCDDLGPFHEVYALSGFDSLLFKPTRRKGELYHADGLVVEVVETDPAGLPSRVAFHFNAPLDSSIFEWFAWDWRTGFYRPFEIPAIGASLTLLGPKGDAAKPKLHFP
jgi:hypothetical protein